MPRIPISFTYHLLVLTPLLTRGSGTPEATAAWNLALNSSGAGCLRIAVGVKLELIISQAETSVPLVHFNGSASLARVGLGALLSSSSMSSCAQVLMTRGNAAAPRDVAVLERMLSRLFSRKELTLVSSGGAAPAWHLRVRGSSDLQLSNVHTIKPGESPCCLCATTRCPKKKLTISLSPI